MSKIFLVEHLESNVYNKDYSTNIICAYMDENQAKEHLAKVYDKLIECLSDGKCSDVSRSDVHVDCCDLRRTDDPHELTYGYEKWYIEEVEVFSTVPD